MPIIRSAKKQMKQSRVKRTRNFQLRHRLKEALKVVFSSVKAGDKKTAEASLVQAYKVVDMSAKKNLIHKNNAARRKSRMARMVAGMETAAAAASPKAETKKAEPKKAPAKKAAPKKTEKAA